MSVKIEKKHHVYKKNYIWNPPARASEMVNIQDVLLTIQ